MNCKLTNLKTLHTNRWQQDDTPCFVPFPSQSIKYWITTLLIAMMSIVGAWGQTDKVLDATQIWDYSGFEIAQNYNITYQNRSFTANQWDFISLPFNASQSVLDATFGSGKYQLQQFDSMDNNTFVFKTMETPSITAGYPYLIKVSETVNNPVFTNVTFATTTGLCYGNENVKLYGSLITVAGWDLINNHHAYKMIDGVLTKMSYMGEGRPEQSNILPPSAYIKTDDSTVPSLNIAGSPGEGGDDPDPSTMTMQQKIAARMQLSNAPTVYITLPDKGDTSLDDYLYKKGGEGQKYDEAPYRRASIKVVATDDTTSPHYMESFEEDADHLEIKVRGNSTSMSQYTGHGGSEAKRPYRLKFAKKDKTTGQNFKHDMINGGYSKRNWTLLANAFDHSLIRNALTCELGKIVGMPFNPGYKFVDLVINDEYRGTYQVSDHCEIDGDRINIDEDGWYVEFQGKTQMCDYPMFFAEQGLIMNINNPEPAYAGTETTRADSAAVEQPIIDEVKEWFQNSWKKGLGKNFTNPESGWRAYNDEETLMKFWIITEITGDYDGLMSVKAYRKTDGKLYWGPVWDKDLAYGNYSSMSATNGTLVANMSGNASSIDDYFANNFAKDPEFMTKVKAKMDQLVNGGLKTTLCNKIDELAALVAQTEKLDSAKWNFNGPGTGMEQYHKGVTGYDNYAAYIAQLKTWINGRVDYVQTQFTTLATAANTSAGSVVYDVTKNAYENGQLENGIYKEENTDKYINVTLTGRSFAANEWSAISLPFSVDETQMKTIFGNSYDIKTFTGVSDDGTKMIFETPEDKSIKAGMPYIIKPSQAVADNTIFNKVIFSCYQDWSSTVNPNGESITFGNYTLTSSIYKADLSNKNLIGNDGKTLTATNGSNNGSIVYVTVADGAAAPTIQFGRTVRTQLTNLPTIYIDTKDGAAIQASTGDYVQAAIQVIDSESGPLTSFTESEEYLQIRGRGKAEWSVADGKKSYRLKFAKKHKYDLTGAGYTKRNWILAANAADESMIKNALTKKLGDAVGLPFTPNTCFVDLVVNGKYLGTYTAMDYVEADREDGTSERVDADEKTGWLIEMMNEDGVDKTGDVYVAGTNYTRPWVVIKNPEPSYDEATATPEEIATAKNAVTNPVQTFINNLWTSPETYVDKTTLVNWYIASEILGGTTTLSSVYAYKDAEDTQLKFGPLWGNELAWQNSAMTDIANNGTKDGLIVNSAAESALRNKLQSLWDESWFTSLVASRWLVVKNGLADALKTEADALKSTISASWTKNYTTTESDGAGWTATGTLENDVNTIKTYIDNRIAYLDKKFLLAASDLEYDVTLEDALTAYAGFNNRTVNVTLKNRGTIWGNEWNAICLPFSLTNEQLIAVFGTGYQLKSFKGVTEGETFNTFDFNDTQTTLDAGVPYIIKPTANVTNLTFNNVTLNLSLDNSVVEKTSDKSKTFKFTGTLQPYKMADDGTDWFIGRNNKAYKSNGTLHACRAYFTMPSTQAAAKAFMFGNLITSIDNIVINDNSLENVKIYNLNGQVVGNSWNAVPQGIYIVNGKKVIK